MNNGGDDKLLVEVVGHLPHTQLRDTHHKRRIYKEDKAKVVGAVWGGRTDSLFLRTCYFELG